MEKCEIENCEKSIKAKGMCSSHYEKQRSDKITEICSVDGCNAIASGGRGFCKKHYTRYYTHGDPLITLEPYHDYTPPPKKLCNVAECESIIYAREMCQSHYNKWRLQSSRPFEKIISNPTLCSVDGCCKLERKDKMCRVHGEKFLKWGNTEGQFMRKDLEKDVSAVRDMPIDMI